MLSWNEVKLPPCIIWRIFKLKRRGYKKEYGLFFPILPYLFDTISGR